jgi:class 3 adenylate cyclase
VYGLLDRLAGDVGAGEAASAARRTVAASPGLARLGDLLDRIGWDELHLALLELFPAVVGLDESQRSQRVDVAMLLVDIVRSTQMVRALGDTGFVDRLRRLRKLLRSSTGLLLMKGTGDGYLTVHDTVASALDAARDLRDAIEAPMQLRLVIHRGPVRMSEHDVLGSEVHRLFRIEALGEHDRASELGTGIALPLAGRVVLSQPAFTALPEPELASFRWAGTFRLKGFDDPEPIWVEASRDEER